MTPMQLLSALKGGTDIQKLPYYAARLDWERLAITPTQINTGEYIINPGHYQRLVPTWFFLRVNSASIGALTTLVVGTDEATPVVIFSIPQANLTSGTMWIPGSTNLTLGAGFATALTQGCGIKIYKTGSDATGAFTVDLIFGFTARM